MQYSFLSKLMVLLILGMAFSFQSCLEDDCEATSTFIEFTPRYITEEELRQKIETKESRSLENPGKIYSYGKYIFINELREGLHIIDNTDPKAPENIGFIGIPGNFDMAIRNDILYVDSYTDLLVIDISNPLQIDLLCRMENVYNQYAFWEDRGYLVYYEETERTMEVDCTDPRWGQGRFFVDDVVFANAEAFDGNAGGGRKNTIGVGGSLARFTIDKAHLYAVDEASMYIFDLAVPEKPRQGTTVNLGWGIETIWPYKDLLFIGGNDGMQIFNNDNPNEPFRLSSFSHARACDPVVADDTYAYVTLRGGSACESFTNQLDVINIENLLAPFLVESFPMDNPHGLSKRGDHLFICEGEAGLKVFDASDPTKVGNEMIEHVKNITAYDIITLSDDHAIVIGDEGLHQFDISDKEDLKELSLITVNK